MYNMETLCNAVKETECWDFQNDECKDIAEAVYIMSNRLVDYMHEDYPNICVSRLVRGGSMEERTRLLRPFEKSKTVSNIEFDYLAVIRKWPDIGPLRFKHSCPGYMKLEYDVGDPNFGSDDKRYLKASCTRTMMANMRKSVTTRCEQNFCTHGRTTFLVEEGCSACSVYLKTGNLTYSLLNQDYTPLHFLWTPKVHIATDYYKSCLGKDFMFTETKECSLLPNPNCGRRVIVVDFHPVFELNRANIIQDGLTPIDMPSDSTNRLYLFPKGRSRNYRLHQCEDCCWRISTIAHELALIKSTTSEHRYAYMTLKFLTTILLERAQSYLHSYICRLSLLDFTVNPYIIKTIFFNHVDKCQRPGLDMKECVSEMLADLLNSFQKRDLAHFYLKYNIYADLLDTYPQEEMCLFLSTCLKTVLQSRSGPSVMDEIALDLISLHWILSYQNFTGLKKDSDFFREVEERVDQFMKRRETCSAEETLKIIAWEYKDSQTNANYLKEYGYESNRVPILQRLHDYWKVKEIENEKEEERKKEKNKGKERDTDMDRKTDEQRPAESETMKQ